MQRAGAHDLHLERALAQGAGRGLTHGGERFRKQVVQRLAIGVAGPELVGLGTQLRVGQTLHIGLELIDVIGDAAQPLDQLRLAGTEQTI
jgi:hypothetical protein